MMVSKLNILLSFWDITSDISHKLSKLFKCLSKWWRPSFQNSHPNLRGSRFESKPTQNWKMGKQKRVSLKQIIRWGSYNESLLKMKLDTFSDFCFTNHWTEFTYHENWFSWKWKFAPQKWTPSTVDIGVFSAEFRHHAWLASSLYHCLQWIFGRWDCSKAMGEFRFLSKITYTNQSNKIPNSDLGIWKNDFHWISRWTFLCFCPKPLGSFCLCFLFDQLFSWPKVSLVAWLLYDFCFHDFNVITTYIKKQQDVYHSITSYMIIIANIMYVLYV